MFYCKDCAMKNGWPTADYIPKSVGSCECCKTIDVNCFDVPSKNLPMPKDEGRSEMNKEEIIEIGKKAAKDKLEKRPGKEEKAEPEKGPCEEPKKKKMSPDEAFDKICKLITKLLGTPSVEEDEYVDIEKAVLALQSVFYVLLRDHVTVGAMNKAIRDALKGKPQFTDDLLAAKADSLVKMIFRGEYLVHEVESSYEIG